MARMHARRKGRSKSTKPRTTGKPKWVEMTPEEVTKVIVTMAKEGKSTAYIGIVLRDQYGIPDVREVAGKSITQICEENGIKFNIPEDMANLMRNILLDKKNTELTNSAQLLMYCAARAQLV